MQNRDKHIDWPLAKRALVTAAVASLVAWGSGPSVLADELDVEQLADMSLGELLDIDVTTASLLAQSAKLAPATTYVITDATIRMRGYSTLIDLLSDIPEVQIQQDARQDARYVITFRGIGGGIGNEKFVLLIDGQRLSPATGDFYPLGKQFSLAGAKQVEIVMGPASALYGADAFSGVINVITKKGAELDGGSVELSYGQYGTYEGSFAVGADLEDIPALGGALEKAQISLTGHLYHSDEPFFPDYYGAEYAWYTDVYLQTGAMRANVFAPPDDVRTVEIKPFEQPTDARFIHARVLLNDFEIGHVSTSEAHGTSRGQMPEFSLYWKEATMRVNIDNTYASHTFDEGDGRIQIHSAVSAQRHFIAPESAFHNSFSEYLAGYKYASTRTLSLNERLTWKVTEKSPLVVGFSLADVATLPRTDDLPVPYDPDLSADEQELYYPGTDIMDANGNSLRLAQDLHFLQYQNIGGFAQAQIGELDLVEITAGARYDHNTRYGGSFNPRAAITANPIDEVHAKVIYGEAFLAPSPYKSYMAYGAFLPETDENDNITGLRSGYLFRPNADLQPEKLRSAEVAVLWQPLDGMRFGVHGYFTDINNLIEPGPAELDQTFRGIPVGAIQRNVNGGGAHTYGGTVHLDVLREVGPVQVRPRLAYTYSDGKEGDDDEPLALNSKHTIRAGVDVQVPLGPGRFSISPRLLYRSRAHTSFTDDDGAFVSVDGHAVLDAFAQYTWQASNRLSASLFARVNNATDNRYYHAHSEQLGAFVATPQDPIRVVTGLRASF